MKALLRTFLLTIFCVGLLYLTIWGPLFQVWKLQLAGHQVISAQSSLLSNPFPILPREIFIHASLSPNKKTIVVSAIIGRKWYEEGKSKIILFDLDSGRRLWEVQNKISGSAAFSKFIWSKDGNKVLVYGFSDLPQIINTKDGLVFKTLAHPLGCVWLKSEEEIIKPSFFLNVCWEKNDVYLISEKDLSLIWKKSFLQANQIMPDVDAKIDQVPDFQKPYGSMYTYFSSPDKTMFAGLSRQYLRIYDSKTNLKKFPDVTAHWSIDSVVWNSDSSMIASGGDDYNFTGVDGEVVYPVKNILLLKIDSNSIQKRRLLTYSENSTAIDFIENSKKLVGLTENAILVWNLQK
jgi:WD40 repeat protein